LIFKPMMRTSRSANLDALGQRPDMGATVPAAVDFSSDLVPFWRTSGRFVV